MVNNNKEILNSGYNNMYNQIFCNIFPLNNGFKTCENCNFGDGMSLLNTNTAQSSQNCLIKCKNNEKCTSYTYNNVSKNDNCNLYYSFPTGIVNNVPNISSGYDLTKFTYNYNNLNSQQQQNVQYKCANQYMNNIYTEQNKDLDLGSCLTINNDNQSTFFKYNPECVYNIYKSNNVLSSANVKNLSQYNGNKDFENAKHDYEIENRQKNYNDYLNAKIQNYNINYKLKSTDKDYVQYNESVRENNKNLYNDFLNIKQVNADNLKNLTKNINENIGSKNKIEGFDVGYNIEYENGKKMNILIIFLLIILLIIFLFSFNILKKK